jgi:hypothetical protein
MFAHHLKLNLEKTELLILPGKSRPLKDLSITVDNSTVPPFQSVKNLGMILDNTLSVSVKHQSSEPLLPVHALQNP